jgi:hypothetical protein
MQPMNGPTQKRRERLDMRGASSTEASAARFLRTCKLVSLDLGAHYSAEQTLALMLKGAY